MDREHTWLGRHGCYSRAGRGPGKTVGRNAIMWTNVVRSEKADYVWIQMLGAGFLIH